MDADWYAAIVKSSAGREVRDHHARLVLDDETRFPTLFKLACNTADAQHHKACWIMELVLEQRLDLLAPFLEDFCGALPFFTHDGAQRSISKICLFLCEPKRGFKLTDNARASIAETCLDWLIGDAKVATKAYAMRALAHLAKEDRKLSETLRRILEEDYSRHSAAYRAAAKDVLRQLYKLERRQ